MDREEKIKIIITTGIGALILLILVIFLALSGKDKGSDEDKLDASIEDYAGVSASESSLEPSGTENSSTGTSGEDAAGLSSGDGSSGETIEGASEVSGQSASTGSSGTGAATSAGSVTGADSGNGFYGIAQASLKDVYKNIKYDLEAQLKEMYTYWSEGNMEAVRDLAHLERFEAMSNSLKGSSDFYYRGDKNSQGLPDGKGLAVYADDQYYFGDWKNGVRSGQGTWIAFYPNNTTQMVKEHLYTGGWSSDLPDGQGQEHFDYLTQYMKADERYLQNAIGGFSAGKYNGDMYIILVKKDGSTSEWVGVCEKGSWEQIPYATVDNTGKIPVLNGRENSDDHIYMTRASAKNSGILGITKSGMIR